MTQTWKISFHSSFSSFNQMIKRALATSEIKGIHCARVVIVDSSDHLQRECQPSGTLESSLKESLWTEPAVWENKEKSRGQSIKQKTDTSGAAKQEIIMTIAQASDLTCANHFSQVLLFTTLWTAACRAPLSSRILQARILKWVAMPSSSISPRPRDLTHVSYI